jgi:LysR family hydrogen peroxide-inducible transcriptional activator
MKHLPSPRHLRYLCALEEHLHFGRAAEACAVTQSTLSAGLRDLEALLGASLVERTKRRVAFTPLGRAVATRARRVLRESEDLVDLARGSGEPLSGDLRLGLIPTVAPYLLPRALPLVRAAHPRLRPYLREDQSADLLDQLDAARLDAVVLALPYPLGEHESMVLARDELLLVCPRAHPLAARDTVRPADLAKAPLLLLEDGHCLREHAIRACGTARRGGRETFQGTSLRSLVPMVSNGLGVTLIPAMALDSEVGGDSDLVARPLEPPGGAREVVLVWRAHSPRADEFRLLGQTLQAALCPEPANDPGLATPA